MGRLNFLVIVSVYLCSFVFVYVGVWIQRCRERPRILFRYCEQGRGAEMFPLIKIRSVGLSELREVQGNHINKL